MWLVGNELEDPFGCDANDLPMLLYHQHFCRKAQNALVKNPRDQWTVSSGEWRDPRPFDPQKQGVTPDVAFCSEMAT